MNFTFLLLVIACNIVHVFGDGETSAGEQSNISEPPVTVIRTIAKRHESQSCVDNFDIHQDRIIRTQDSKAMGARYINERDVTSRDECLQLCCETQGCDVFVFEEKSPGSCYLFECGMPEDFKCKFTQHRNYSSAVLARNRHQAELETQIKLTQHEQELTNLRKPELVSSEVIPAAVTQTATNTPTGAKETAQLIPALLSSKVQPPEHHRCSRYQFECRSSGECIAIYNACDGIPQCSDGSDEAPELGCPASASTGAPVRLIASANMPKPGVEQALPVTNIQYSPPHLISYHQQSPNQVPLSVPFEEQPLALPAKQWVPQPQLTYSAGVGGAVDYAHSYNPPANSAMLPPQQTPQQLIKQARIYGREGEAYHNPPPQENLQSNDQWPPYQHASNGNSQIFTHKGNGLMAQSESVGTQYGESQQADYTKYGNYYDSAPYRMFPQSQYNWQLVHKPHDASVANGLGPDDSMQSRVGEIGPGAGLPQVGPDYYYEDSYRKHLQPAHTQQGLVPQLHPPANIEENRLAKSTLHELESKAESAHAGGSTVKKATAHHQNLPATTEKPKGKEHHDHQHSSHRKVDQLNAEVKVEEARFADLEMAGQNNTPSGAILSLTMGLCVTGIMLVLVGCRMRMVKRRMRRGGKSPYAHDADFLVNGMYL